MIANKEDQIMNRKTFITVVAASAFGGVVAAVIVILALLPPTSAAAAPRQAGMSATGATSAVAGLLTYQGYLTDSGGDPINGNADFQFGIYAAETGGSPVWEELHNNVVVTDGYFSVLLGTTTPLTTTAFVGGERWLQVSVNTGGGYTDLDRQRIASVPYALNADAVGGQRASDLVPPGVIVMWSGSVENIPDGWALCDGSNGTPDLRGSFVVGYDGGDSDYDVVGETGGEREHALTAAEIPTHTHTIDPPQYTTGSGGSHSHQIKVGGSSSSGEGAERGNYAEYGFTATGGAHTHTFDIPAFDSGEVGAGQVHENRPPYYTLAYIIKLP
jgi:microcystin-dependent protein